MPEPEDRPKPPPKPNHMVEQVGAREARMIRRRAQGPPSFWRSLPLIGVGGWMVALPMLAGIAIGTWIDHRWPSQFSWTLMLLVAGLGAGCLLAWDRIERERKDH